MAEKSAAWKYWRKQLNGGVAWRINIEEMYRWLNKWLAAAAQRRHGWQWRNHGKYHLYHPYHQSYQRINVAERRQWRSAVNGGTIWRKRNVFNQYARTFHGCIKQSWSLCWLCNLIFILLFSNVVFSQLRYWWLSIEKPEAYSKSVFHWQYWLRRSIVWLDDSYLLSMLALPGELLATILRVDVRLPLSWKAILPVGEFIDGVHSGR